MDHPVRKPVIHHPGKLRELHAVTVEVNSARRAVKGEIKYSVIPLAEQIQVVLQFFTRVACEMAKLRVHGLRDQL